MATRYDKRDYMFQATIDVVSICIWLKDPSDDPQDTDKAELTNWCAEHRIELVYTPQQRLVNEALDLVRGILGADRVAAEPQAVTELIQICARLPLALRIAAGHAANRPHHLIADVVAGMASDRARLDALSTVGDDPTSVRAGGGLGGPPRHADELVYVIL